MSRRCIHATVAGTVRRGAALALADMERMHNMTKDRDTVWKDWTALVNMAPQELDKWQKTELSQSVGDTGGEGESTGHRSARKIVIIKRTRKDDLTDEQWEWMANTVGYIRRHKAQRPKGDVTDTKWRYSLMNWGHDPLKDF